MYTGAQISSAYSNASPRFMCAAAYTVFFAARTVSGAFAAIVSAIACAVACRSASGTTSLTSPISRARAASMGSPVNRIWSATFAGMSHPSGAAHGDPRPTLASVTAKRAWSAAMVMSHICASRNPPAYATPFTAAIVGFSTSMLRPKIGRKSGGGISSDVSAISLRSPPAQNALSPAPVSTSTSAVSSSLKRRAPAHRPSRTALLSALRASSRSMVSQAMRSSTS